VSPVAAHEFSRIPLLASLSGEQLRELGQRMRRERVSPGETLVQQGEAGERFYVVLSGLLEVTQQGRGNVGLLRPGDHFGEVALAMHMPRTASVRVVTPATVASCDRATFDEYVRPLFADD
jgi:ATP-binding cassette subfamily B protein